MKTKIIMALTACLFTAFQLKAQKGLYIGIEASKIHDQYVISNPESVVTSPYPHFVNPQLSFLMGYGLNDIFSIESGFIRKPYVLGYSYSLTPNTQHSNGTTITHRYQIPLRMHARIKLINDKLYLKTTVGYHYGFSPRTADSRSVNNQGSNDEQIMLDVTTKTYQNNYSLIETGLGLEYWLGKNISIYNNVSLLSGFSNIESKKVAYQLENEATVNTIITNTGSYLNVGLGLKILMGGRK